MSAARAEDDFFPGCQLRLAVTGKGGVGKTILAALIGRRLTEQGQRVLLVDGDPAMGLAYLFGVDTNKTIGGFRDQLRRNPQLKREIETASVKDLLVRESLIHLDERTGMLIMGKDESDDCFCGVNNVLKYGIGSIAQDYQALILDCEAGLEQVKRRVLNTVNLLLVVSDMSARGTWTARQIAGVLARKEADVALPDRAGLVINRYQGDQDFLQRARQQSGLELWAAIPEDGLVAELDLSGQKIGELRAEAPSYLGVQRMLERLGLT
ncbi:MAG: AAA family ATPase [Thermodesulfobacteriota bacterium]